ncbi:MAG: AraC family transcriptional regulator [Pseudomonadota bacterium]
MLNSEMEATLSGPDLAGIAGRFGCRYGQFSRLVVSNPSNSKEALFSGVVADQTLPSGMSVAFSELRCLEACQIQGHVPRLLSIAVSLAGDPVEKQIGNAHRLFLPAGTAAAVRVGHEVEMSTRPQAGAQAKTLLLMARPEDLADEELAERVDADLSQTGVQPLNLSPRAQILLTELADPATSGLISRLLAESCALELLSRYLGMDQETTGNGFAVSMRDRSRIRDVETYLRSEPGLEHTLAGLARLAGMSTSGLKRKFHAVTGQSVFNYLRGARLETAYRLIADDGWTVAQAAYFVGYRHQSNFASAFRRKFGVTPKQLRRH